MKNKTFKYEGYYGSIDFSIEDGLLFGEIQGINDVILYEGHTLQELKTAFEEAVEDYLLTCKDIGKQPDKALSGSLNVRIGQNNHKKLYRESMDKELSINECIKQIINDYFNNKEAETRNTTTSLLLRTQVKCIQNSNANNIKYTPPEIAIH